MMVIGILMIAMIIKINMIIMIMKVVKINTMICKLLLMINLT